MGDMEEIDKLVKKYAAVDGSEDPRKSKRYYMTVYGGSTSNKAAKVASQLPLDEGESVEDLIEQAHGRIAAARTTGSKRLFVRFYERKDSRPVDVVVLEGDTEGDGDDGEPTSIVAANAQIVVKQFAEWRHLFTRNEELQSELSEIKAQYYGLRVELEYAKLYGDNAALTQGLDAVTKNLAPYLPTLPAVIRAIRQPAGSIREKARDPRAPDSATLQSASLEALVVELEGAAEDLAAAVMLAVQAATLTDGDRAALAARLEGLRKRTGM